MRFAGFLLATIATVGVPVRSHAGVLGVPTGLSTDGQRCTGPAAPVASCVAASANPPGYLALTGTNVSSATGDVSHQMRFFIEVTGSTLDIKVFDPGTGTSGANGVLDSNILVTPLTTRFRLYDPTDTVLDLNGGVDEGGDLDQGFDTVAGTITEGRLVRFSCNNGAAPTFTAANAGTVWGAGGGGCAALPAGRYIFEVTEGSGVATNVFGVQATDAAGAPYNVYTEGTADDIVNAVDPTDNSLVYGRPAAGGSNGIAAAMVTYPYVTGGCSAEAMNFDTDSSGTIDLVDALGAATSLAVSGNDVVATTVVPLESTAGLNYRIDNYGVFRQTQSLAGAGSNFADIRYADWQGSTPGSPATHPGIPVSPLRTYLPNGYTACTATNCTMTAPEKPFLSQSAVVSSGNNPPVVGVGQATTFLISATLLNTTATTLINPSITIAYDPTPSVGGDAAFASGSDACSSDGVALSCSVIGGSAGGLDFRTSSFVGSVGPGQAFTVQYEVIVSDIVSPGPFDLTAPPSAVDPVSEASYTPAFSSVTFPTTEGLGALCQIRSDTAAATLTWARIRGVKVDRSSVTFVVASQRKTRSFQIYGIGGFGGIRLASIEALGPDSATPTIYHASVRADMFGAIRIEETERSGRVRVLGEFATTDRRSRAAVDRLVDRLSSAGATTVPTRGGQVTTISPSSSARFARSFESPTRRHLVETQRRARRDRRGASALKAMVQGAGTVTVDRASLIAAGLPSSVATSKVRVFRDGEELAVDRRARPRDAGSISFEATGSQSLYSADNAYVLTWGRESPTPASVGLTPAGPTLERGFERVEKSIIYLASAAEGSDPWLWDVLVAGSGLWPYASDPGSGTFDLPGLRPGLSDDPVEVRVHLVGRSSHRHSVSARLNGVELGEVQFTGESAATLFGVAPVSVLQSSGNLLTLDYAGNQMDPDDLALVYLDSLDIAMPPGQRQDAPARLSPYDETVPRGRADYLIVTHADFLAEAEEIAQLKRGQGLLTQVVDVERVYDRFSAGVPEARAVRELIRSLRGVQHVLIVGDDTIDYKGALGPSDLPIVPSLYAWEPEFGLTPSEAGYADVDGVPGPEIAIGRLPVQTVEEARAMVAKIARQDRVLAANVNRHLLVTDDQADGDPSFREHAEGVAASLSRDTGRTFADLSDGLVPARARLLDALGDGVGFTSYFGHGGPDRWADEDLLTVEDVPALAGTPETVLLMWACEAQYYPYVYGQSLGEAMLLLPQGGALASIGPSGISTPNAQKEIYDELYRQMSSHGRGALTLGEAFRRAKAAAAVNKPGVREALAGFNLLGDPALRIR